MFPGGQFSIGSPMRLIQLFGEALWKTYNLLSDKEKATEEIKHHVRVAVARGGILPDHT